MDLLPLTWYIQSPIDFEHKQYILFAYLQRVDISFSEKIVSPHLLHLEKIEKELLDFSNRYNNLKDNIDNRRYKYFETEQIFLKKDKPIAELKDIVDFSVIQIKPRIQLGYKIFSKYKQLLY
jgi:hypothetical protein